MTKKEFRNLKTTTQIEGLFEATEAFFKPGKDKDYFFKNADESFKDFLMRRDKNKPFALSINFNLPHAASIGGMGKKETDPEWYKTGYNESKEKFEFPAGYPLPVQLPKEVFAYDELMPYYNVRNKKALLDKKVKMARAVHAIDSFVAKVRALLDEMDLDDNTIIVFASDHGLLLGEHGLGGKTFLYDYSIHIPMIVMDPRIKHQAARSSELVVGQDIPATILDLCAQKIPSSYQSKSMAPLIKGKKVDWRQDIFCENLFTYQGYPRMEAVRSHEWKYIRYFSKENDREKYLPMASIQGEKPIYEELFNIIEDPEELNNLATKPEYADILKKYQERCKTLVVQLEQ